MEPAETIVLAPRLLHMSKQFPTERERLTPEERRARDTERRLDAEQALREHQLAQEARYRNLERLRAERLARETLVKNKALAQK